LKQYEAVIQVMEENGGYATLSFLYQTALDVEGCEWQTRTPFASIRRIVQDERFFFKIKPGLWALKSYKAKLPAYMVKQGDGRSKEVQQFNHTYYQGMIIELGRLRDFKTYVPAQDKGKKFLGRERLGDMAHMTAMPAFTYKRIIDRTKSIDAVWFNGRGLPDTVFEVEHSTDIRNSLSKFVELQDFRTAMLIVADERRHREFERLLQYHVFEPIWGRVGFLNYETLTKQHSLTTEARIQWAWPESNKRVITGKEGS